MKTEENIEVYGYSSYLVANEKGNNLLILFFSNAIMLYCNSDDTSSLCSFYLESQKEDNVISIGEFIRNKLLINSTMV